MFIPLQPPASDRAALVHQIRGLLEAQRVVALTGPPAIGKTEVAAGVAEGEASRRTICVGHRGDPEQAVAHVEACLNDLDTPQTLLVLDEAEAILAARPGVLAEWGSSHPSVRILLTSRCRGQVGGVVEVQVPALSFDEAMGRLDGMDHEPSHLRAIARALRGAPVLLDAAADALGMMMGHEVARMTTCGKGLAELAVWAGLDIESVFEAGLDAQARALLEGCAWLPGGAPLDLLRSSVAGANPAGLRALVDRGLLMMERPDVRRPAQVVVPPLVRAALGAAGEPPKAFLRWAVTQMTQVAESLDPGSPALLDNVAAVYGGAALATRVEEAHIAVLLAQQVQEDWSWLHAESMLIELAAHPDLDGALRTQVYLALGDRLGKAGDLQARVWLTRAHDLASQLEDAQLRASVAHAYGTRLVLDGEREQGTLVMMAGLEDARTANCAKQTGALLCQLGGFHAAEGMYRSGLELMDEALRILRDAGEAKLADEVNHHRAELLGAMGRTDEALDILQRCRHAGIRGGPRSMHVYAGLLLRQGAATAGEAFQKAADGYREHGNRLEAARASVDLALCSALEGRQTEAEARGRVALEQLTTMGIREYEAETWGKFALVELCGFDCTSAMQSLAEARWRAGTRYPVMASRCDVLLAALGAAEPDLTNRLQRLLHRSPGEDPILDLLLAALAWVPRVEDDQEQLAAAREAWRSLSGVHNVTARMLGRILLRQLEQGKPALIPPHTSESSGLGCFVACARETALALAAGDLELASEQAARLAEIAGESGDAALIANARFWTWASGDQDPGTVLELAHPDYPGARARRRARALLSLPSALDSEDEEVLSAVVPCLRWGLQGSVGTAHAVPYLLDHTRAELVHPDGSRTALRRSPLLFRMIELLAAEGKTKEDLAEALWPDEAYHPLLHDNRLRVAVHRLRGMGLVDFVQTKEDGYALSHPLLEAVPRSDDLTGMDWRRVSTSLTPKGYRRR